MKSILTLCLVAAAFAAPCRADVLFDDLFHLDPHVAERSLGAERVKVLRAALDDVNAVLNHKKPVHAALDTELPLPADGGTAYYRGAGYRLTIVKSLFRMGDGAQAVQGFMYGPVLSLGPELGTGNADSISRVSFYPIETLNKALK